MNWKPLITLTISFLFSFVGLELSAQTVQAGIFNPVANTISVKARPSGAISGLFSGVNVTIRWLTSLGVTFSTVTSSYSIAPQGPVGSDPPFSYQSFASTPNTAISWSGGSENELFTVAVLGGSGTGTFELTNTPEGTDWYVEHSSNDITDYSVPFYQQTTEVGLPIQLSNLTATVVNQNSVRLDWTTLTKTNNYGSEVQKSQGNQNNYQTIPNSFIPGHGTTIEPHSYSYVDNTASVGLWYYRLKQIDLDGPVHFTEGVQVDVLTGVNEKQLPKEFALDQNYPNPFNPATLIQYALPKESSVSLKVYNALGQEVAVLAEGVQQAGEYQVQLDASSLASGTYIYRLTTDKFTSSKKLTVLR
jgi:hypothetical protein